MRAGGKKREEKEKAVAHNEKKSRLCFRRCPYTLTRARKKLSGLLRTIHAPLEILFTQAVLSFSLAPYLPAPKRETRISEGCTSDSFIRRELNAHLAEARRFLRLRDLLARRARFSNIAIARRNCRY